MSALRRIAALAMALAAVAVACSSSGTRSAPAPGAMPATPIHGATPLEASLMRSLLGRNPAGSVRSVDVVRPPASMLMRDDGKIDKNRYSARDVWLVVTVPAPPGGVSAHAYEIPLWKGEIFAMAVQTEMFRAASRANAHNLRAAVGFTVSTVDKAGHRSHSEVVSTQGWPAEDAHHTYLAGDAAVRRAVVAQLAADGITRAKHGPVRLESITLFEGVDPAPIVRLRATGSTADATTTVGSTFGSAGPAPYEGYVLEVDGPDGRPIELGANVGRAHYGSSWTDPRYRALLPGALTPVHG